MSRRDLADLVDEILAKIKRRKDDGGVVEQPLINQLAAQIKGTLDFDEIALQKAKELIDRRTKPRSTTPDGQLLLPMFDRAYDYEPDRLIRDDMGNIIEQSRAVPAYKQAEARRASKHAEESAFHARIKTEEALAFSQWWIDQTRAGRKARELTYDTFVRESGIWRSLT